MKNSIIVLVVCIGLMALFNNCGKVGFSGAPVSPTANSSLSQTFSSESDPGASDEDLLASLPEEERGIFRPLSDLSDPDVAKIYICGDGNSYMICHFPSSIGSEHTLCVGRSAVRSHADHELTFAADGSPQGDYLGPCKSVPNR
ncbi:MAG: hypothetical protein SGJ18_03935 [Pseudomonadota bacterium]|nr:hypothetical protein [Pseudomonadota bacterium]